VVLLFTAILLNVGAQLLLKYAALGAAQDRTSLMQFKLLIFSWPFWGAIVLYGLSFLAYTIVLTKLELSRAYPITSISAIVLLIVVSIPLYHEPLTIYKMAGVVISAVGIILLFK